MGRNGGWRMVYREQKRESEGGRGSTIVSDESTLLAPCDTIPCCVTE
jgi:hypothetical protein